MSKTKNFYSQFSKRNVFRVAFAAVASFFLAWGATAVYAGTITPSSLGTWGSGVETGTGSLDFVFGPGTPPAGDGSAQFTLVDGTSGVVLGTAAYPAPA